MNILIIFYSYSGNTKKVAELVKEKLENQEVLLKNALTVTTAEIEQADTILIGSPIHGYILFGQKVCKEVKKVLEKKLPADLKGKKVLLFATYMFWPGKALKKCSKVIEAKNGKILGLISDKAKQKENLANQIVALTVH